MCIDHTLPNVSTVAEPLYHQIIPFLFNSAATCMGQAVPVELFLAIPSLNVTRLLPKKVETLSRECLFFFTLLTKILVLTATQKAKNIY